MTNTSASPDSASSDVQAPADASSTTDPRKTRRVGITVGLFLMMISVAITSTFLVIGGSLVFRNMEALFWKQTDGALIEARVDHISHPKNGTEAPPIPVVKYSFVVAGKTYISDHWSPAGLGLDMPGQIAAMNRQPHIKVYYSESVPSDCAVVLPSPHIGFLPFTMGLGLFFILVIAISGGTLFAALHPELAADPQSSVRRVIGRSLRIGFALTLSSLTGLLTMLLKSPGGWWQWALSAVAVAIAIRPTSKR